MPEFINIATLREQRRKIELEERIPFEIRRGGSVISEMVTKRIKNGLFETIVLPKPVREMLTTDEGRVELMRKVVLDVEFGREQVPVLYQPIYSRIGPDETLPETLEAKWALRGTVLFTEHMEGEEVKFGRLLAEQGPVVRLTTWAAAFEYTEDIEVYNQVFNLTMLNQAFGEAYNALLNDIHLRPIFEHNYPSANTTQPVYVKADLTPTTQQAGDYHYVLSLRETLKKALADSRRAKRPGTVLLVSGAIEPSIREALGNLIVRGTDLPPLGGIDTVIAYDGWAVKVGKKDYSYPGVPETEAYLIRPRQGFKEIIKHDLRVDASGADLSRLVVSQIVGRARRGVFLAPDENTQKIVLPVPR